MMDPGKGRPTDLPTLVELNEIRSGRTVFCFHPAGGGMGSYTALAGHLADAYRLYGLEDPYVYGGFAYGSLPELAEHHVEVIRSVQPEGPYVLFGSCSGGVIAYETACQLLQEGLQVERVVMFGTHGLAGFDARVSEKFAFLQSYLAARFKLNLTALDWPALEQRTYDEVTARIVSELLRQGVLAADAVRNDWVNRLLRCCIMTRQATKRYVAPRSQLHVDLYKQPRAPRREEDPPPPKDWCDWHTLTTGRIRVFDPPGTLAASDDILVEPHVLETARAVRSNSLASLQ